MTKRVVLVVPAFPKLSETFIVSKFLGLIRKGLDVHVVCAESKREEWGRFPELEADHGLRNRIHIVWPHRSRLLAAFLSPAALLYCLARNPLGTLRYLTKGAAIFGINIVRRFYLDASILALNPSIVHFEFGALAVDRMYLQDLLNCRIVVSFRGYDINYVGLDQPDYYRAVWEKADALHLLGEDLWKKALRRGCPVDKPHALIPPAIDTAFFSASREHSEPAGTDERPLRILSVGRLDWRKGYEYAVKAIEMLRNAGIKSEYRIIGGGEFLEPLAFAIHQLGVKGSVAWLGAQPREFVRQEMQWADVFLHASVSEGFCNSVIESQSVMLPVVCSDAGGLPENVKDGETGFVVPRRNSEALADKLELLARDPALRQRMGTAGRARVIEKYRIEEQVEKFSGLYRTIIDAGTGQSQRSEGPDTSTTKVCKKKSA